MRANTDKTGSSLKKSASDHTTAADNTIDITEKIFIDKGLLMPFQR